MASLTPYKDYKPVALNFTKQIPSDWIVKRGKFFFKEISERSKKGEEQLLSVSEHKGIVPRDTINVTMFQALSYVGYKLCNKGDIVINSLWAWHRGLGVSEHHGIVSTAYGVYRPLKPEQWNHRYLNYLLRDRTYVGECLIRSKGIWESRYQLTGSNFLDIPVLQPPLSVQNSIVAYLDKKNEQIDTFIRNKEKLIELLEEEKKTFISNTVKNDFLRTPNHWKKSKLKYAISRIGDGLHGTPEYVNESDYYFINGNNLINGRIEIGESAKPISELEYKKHKKELGENTVLYSINGTIGNVAFYNGEKVALGKSAAYINCKKQLSKEYLFYILQSKIVIEYFVTQMNGTTIFNLSLHSLRNTPLTIPPMNEQIEIVNEIKIGINKIDLAISKARQEITSIKEYREAIITDFVIGKRSVP